MFDKIIEAIKRYEKTDIAEVIETRHDTNTNITTPKIKITNDYGTFETWAEDGESVKDYKWTEVNYRKS